LREVTTEDAEAVLDLVTLCDIAESGETTYTLDEIDTRLARTTLRGAVLDDPAGGLMAYAWLSQNPALRIALGSVHLRPGGDWSIGPQLVDWLRDTAKEFGDGFELHCFTAVANSGMCRLFEGAGGEVVRRYYRMGIALDADRPATRPPDGVVVRPVTGDADVREMYDVIEPAFADHYAHEPMTYEQWRERSVDGLCPDLGLWWLAEIGGRPAAGLYAMAAPQGGWIDTLGTLREFRGRGLGRALLHTAFAEFRRRGLPKAGLSVDATNPTGALGLYESVGMTVEHEDVRYSLPVG
jgi:ribosomal protein S18 acetylase RimI-like enzyme